MKTKEQLQAPGREEARALLAWAEEQNPGPWGDHSRAVGRTAQVIAEACGMDGELAYTLGLLHDIGRYEGVRDLHHALAGYALLMEKGWPLHGRISLTHSFPIRELDAHAPKGEEHDCTPEELAFLRRVLEEEENDRWDELIQLCDSICLPQGVCLIEKRLVDVTRRYGFNRLTLPKWEALFAIKERFDRLCGGSIYPLFQDEIREISFL